jgi:hypothetical protein
MVTRLLDCECGFEAAAENLDGLVAEIRRHAREEHGMTLSVGEALEVASRASAVEQSSRTPRRALGNRLEEER